MEYDLIDIISCQTFVSVSTNGVLSEIVDRLLPYSERWQTASNKDKTADVTIFSFKDNSCFCFTKYQLQN